MYSTSHQIPQPPFVMEYLQSEHVIITPQNQPELQVRQSACPSATYQITGIQLTGDISQFELTDFHP
jgi:hypothetical protein